MSDRSYRQTSIKSDDPRYTIDIHHLPGAVAIFDSKGRITEANPKGIEVFATHLHSARHRRKLIKRLSRLAWRLSETDTQRNSILPYHPYSGRRK